MNWIDNSGIGKHGQALSLWTRRAEIIAGNIANADTPRYQARDLDFAAELRRASGTAGAGSLATTHSRHLPVGGLNGGHNITYRETSQASPDGNTVHMEVEQAAYSRNAVKFQASAQFFDGSLRGLKKAFRGE